MPRRHERVGPIVTTIVLAAGGSSRMIRGHKLLEPAGGRPLVAWAVRAALDAELGPVRVVTGDRSDGVAAAVAAVIDTADTARGAGGDVILLENPDWRGGMATSLRLGVAALPKDADAFAVALGDMPLVRSAHYRTLASAWTSGSVVVPVHEGRRGHPVIWSREFAPEMVELDGDRGARTLLERHKNAVVEVSIGDRGVLVDVDTRDRLAIVRDLLSGGSRPG